MNIRAVDLNLLAILDALLDEAHVTRAAERLGLSQPAASSALERCRYLFQDPLLEREGARMRLTPKAEALRAPLRALMADIAAVLDPPTVALKDLRRTVRVVMADHPALVVAVPLYAALAQSAPGIAIVIQPWRGAAAALDVLAKGTADLAVSVLPAVDAEFRRELLFEERYVVAMRQGHPAAVGFGLERWLEYPHVLVSGQGATRGALDEALARLGRERRVGIVVPSFLMVPPLLLNSDLVAMLPSRCLPADTRQALAVFEPTIPVDGFPLHLTWHARRDRDPAVQHVADILRKLLRA